MEICKYISCIYVFVAWCYNIYETEYTGEYHKYYFEYNTKIWYYLFTETQSYLYDISTCSNVYKFQYSIEKY